MKKIAIVTIISENFGNRLQSIQVRYRRKRNLKTEFYVSGIYI